MKVMEVNLMWYYRTIQFSVFLLATVQILILHKANYNFKLI